MAQTEIQSAYIALLLDCRFDMDVCMEHVVVQEMLHIAVRWELQTGNGTVI